MPMLDPTLYALYANSAMYMQPSFSSELLQMYRNFPAAAAAAAAAELANKAPVSKS